MAFDSHMYAQRKDAIISETSCEPVPSERRTELSFVHNELAQSVERVHQLALLLESRLVDVTLPSEASKASVKDPGVTYATRVAAAFSEQVRILTITADGLDSLLNRLEV